MINIYSILKIHKILENSELLFVYVYLLTKVILGNRDIIIIPSNTKPNTMNIKGVLNIFSNNCDI